MKVSIRTYDIVGGYGSEEFLAVLQNKNYENTFSLTEKILKDIVGSLLTKPLYSSQVLSPNA